MPPQRLLPQQFMHQPKEIREYLSQMWKIPRSGISEVRDQTIISDGHTYDDLAVITLERMNDYIGSEESFGRAWELTCMKAHSELHPPVGTITGNPQEIKSVQDMPEDTTVSIPDAIAVQEVAPDITPVVESHDEKTKTK